jgi:bisphosphoglycerate-independent phosphoglycerate mutase (AlkP superfamily)
MVGHTGQYEPAVKACTATGMVCHERSAQCILSDLKVARFNFSKVTKY